MARNAHQCLACLRLLDETAISLTGGARKHICFACWKTLPKFRRIQLQLFCRTVPDGGVGIREFLLRLVEAMERAAEYDETDEPDDDIEPGGPGWSPQCN